MAPVPSNIKEWDHRAFVARDVSTWEAEECNSLLKGSRHGIVPYNLFWSKLFNWTSKQPSPPEIRGLLCKALCAAWRKRTRHRDLKVRWQVEQDILSGKHKKLHHLFTGQWMAGSEPPAFIECAFSTDRRPDPTCAFQKLLVKSCSQLKHKSFKPKKTTEGKHPKTTQRQPEPDETTIPPPDRPSLMLRLKIGSQNEHPTAPEPVETRERDGVSSPLSTHSSWQSTATPEPSSSTISPQDVVLEAAHDADSGRPSDSPDPPTTASSTQALSTPNELYVLDSVQHTEQKALVGSMRLPIFIDDDDDFLVKQEAAGGATNAFNHPSLDGSPLPSNVGTAHNTSDSLRLSICHLFQDPASTNYNHLRAVIIVSLDKPNFTNEAGDFDLAAIRMHAKLGESVPLRAMDPQNNGQSTVIGQSTVMINNAILAGYLTTWAGFAGQSGTDEIFLFVTEEPMWLVMLPHELERGTG
ncbi:hypothetical protein KVT40_007466 [Elsinoe batatas]|uniref:Uncharacterized protein n=1 Tax=Elsinoe batatas TaxID=2601811 RepID=A0A8K0KX48_9PEZI|nr:hypothetical protein KVT40_007466 [Elsinoe batatas]